MDNEHPENFRFPGEREWFRQPQSQTTQERQSNLSNASPAVRGLGLFSIGLGISQILMPKKVSRFIGIKDHPNLMRFLGVREIASGIGIFSQQRSAAPLWSRVGGDVMDLALLGNAFKSRKSNRRRLAAVTAAVAGVTALDYYYSKQLGNGKEKQQQLSAFVVINRPPEELYRFWRNFQNLPRFMRYLESVNTLSDRGSRWIAKLPGGKKIEWESEILYEQPNREIAWRSLEGSDVHHAGSVRFESAGSRGTRVTLKMEPLQSGFGSAIFKLISKVPEQLIREDLRGFKQLMETGEVATTEGQPSGQRSLLYGLMKEERREER